MKPSTPYWLRVIGWSLLSIGFLFVVFYGITGDLWRAGLVTFALLLFFNASKRVVILSKMAQIMDVGLKMGNTKSYPAGDIVTGKPAPVASSKSPRDVAVGAAL